MDCISSAIYPTEHTVPVLLCRVLPFNILFALTVIKFYYSVFAVILGTELLQKAEEHMERAEAGTDYSWVRYFTQQMCKILSVLSPSSRTVFYTPMQKQCRLCAGHGDLYFACNEMKNTRVDWREHTQIWVLGSDLCKETQLCYMEQA